MSAAFAVLSGERALLSAAASSLGVLFCVTEAVELALHSLGASSKRMRPDRVRDKWIKYS